jgi:hypothetical protein
MTETPKPRRRTNIDHKRALKSAKVAVFMKKAGRKARKGGLDPNDRHYDVDFAKSLRRMKPERLDEIMREDEDD